MIATGHSTHGRQSAYLIAIGHRNRWMSQPMSQVKVTTPDPLLCNPSNYPCDLCDLSIEHLGDRGYWGIRGMCGRDPISPPFIWKSGHRGHRSQLHPCNVTPWAAILHRRHSPSTSTTARRFQWLSS